VKIEHESKQQLSVSEYYHLYRMKLMQTLEIGKCL